MPRFTKDMAFTSSIRTLYHHIEKNRDGTPFRARINGKLKEWRRPHSPQWQLPMKHGFKTCFYINETTADEWFTHEDEAKLFHKGITITNASHHTMVPGSWYCTVGGKVLPATDSFASFEEALVYAMKHHMVPPQKKADFPVKEKAPEKDPFDDTKTGGLC